MFKNGVLTINYDTWKDGIASSPFVGCADLRNADIWSKRGALLCGRKSVQETTTAFREGVGPVNIGLISYMRHDESNNRVYAGDDIGRLYTRDASGDWSVAKDAIDNCEGLELWKGHVLYAEETKLQVGEIGGFWFNDWQDFEEGQRNLIDLPHTMLVGQDDVVYMCDGRYIASLQEVPGETFDPDDSNTFTWNPTALDLPEGYVACTLSEIGTYLVIGTYYSEILNRGNRADLFPWDRIAPSFNLPLRTKGNGVWQSVTQGNILYTIVDRVNPKIYASNLTVLELQRELARIGEEVRLYPDAIDVLDEEILTGIGDTNASNLGVYSFRENVLQLKHVLSQGDTDVEIGSVLTIEDGKVLVSWKKGELEGVDLIDQVRYSDYATRFDTPMFTVGTALNAAPLAQFDILLGRRLAEGQGVRLSYRTSLNDEFAPLGVTDVGIPGTYDFATYGAVSKINVTAGLSEVSTIQLRIELTTAEGSTASPELLSVSLF